MLFELDRGLEPAERAAPDVLEESAHLSRHTANVSIRGGDGGGGGWWKEGSASCGWSPKQRRTVADVAQFARSLFSRFHIAFTAVLVQSYTRTLHAYATF